MKGNVDNVDNLSTVIVDNLLNTACFVDNVDNLSTVIVDKPGSMACSVDNVDNLSTVIVDNLKVSKDSEEKASYPQ